MIPDLARSLEVRIVVELFMTDLVVRRLLIDLSQPFDRRWNGGDAFRSAFFNALSMSFVVGEQYFIDSLKQALPLMRQPLLRAMSLKHSTCYRRWIF